MEAAEVVRINISQFGGQNQSFSFVQWISIPQKETKCLVILGTLNTTRVYKTVQVLKIMPLATRHFKHSVAIFLQ